MPWGSQSVKEWRKSVKGIFNRLKACLIGCGVKTQSWDFNKRIVQDDRAAQRIFAFIAGKIHFRKQFIT